jgi:predicted deacylase
MPMLAPGTRWQTEVHERRGPGPTVLVVAGVHGDEVAGPVAAERLLQEAPGRLLAVPRANAPAVAAGTRTVAGEHADLNRNFPRRADEAPRGEAAAAIWELVIAVRPAFVVDLHEGWDFHCRGRGSVGNAVLYNGPVEALARRVRDAVSATVDADRTFSLLRGTRRGSLARATFDVLGVPSFLLETSKRGGTIDERAAQHVLMVRRLLDELIAQGVAHVGAA